MVLHKEGVITYFVAHWLKEHIRRKLYNIQAVPPILSIILNFFRFFFLSSINHMVTPQQLYLLRRNTYIVVTWWPLLPVHKYFQGGFHSKDLITIEQRQKYKSGSYRIREVSTFLHIILKEFFLWEILIHDSGLINLQLEQLLWWLGPFLCAKFSVRKFGCKKELTFKRSSARLQRIYQNFTFHALSF